MGAQAIDFDYACRGYQIGAAAAVQPILCAFPSLEIGRHQPGVSANAQAFVVALLLTRRGPAPSLAGLALVAVAIVLVTGTAAPPGASLWLVPLAALAGVRWRDHLVWAACEGAYFVAHWLFVNGLVEHTKGLPAGWYAVFLLVRLAGIAWLARAAVPSISGRHAPTGTLDRLPSACGKPPPVVGDAAYPPVTEGP